MICIAVGKLIKRGNEMYVYVKFYKCSESEMNDLEKRLIALYDATSSYNKTHGGSGQK